ncbi:aldehyde dehydrogenase family protein [Ponticoccus sp. SC2-23]|uniref:aldehyde dehydrogenase family protein n=1 Tax=Alexandriicola marinus TaxID=2081710 RepID=UPI000FD7C1F7|nr:aldehyde dehydrogenase family protein [Alexandriicola marinus]MBM1220264.1 aldehyde dehydrogenase family protein [Ponticoccus sp. SC6-9]MBM1224950.1 aldehyde dehydrogenase family protein [Ponticoccus sp. SC6-15]MBM1228464.1 aldehyde dehydrogenase family protein [Ponticoccus sp. SC6-38]MBM1233899.1 aldehyde dehydrogenase family protein [Ponticoccus sp. SC6-45]MBM1238965.1 aldehyde dehydrogenase family protein [Ponticoccus sp. SC6-49]MBM1242747.1 aldehyde dehydrogenase family protein [Pontic
MTIKQIFETMEYGPAPESTAEAMAWLEARGHSAAPFINGDWGPARDDFESRNPATGERLAGITRCTADEVARAVDHARAAQPAWEALGGHGRARILYAIARGMQRNSRLLAVMESLDNGKPIRESRDIDVPLAIRHFYFHAGLAQLLESEQPGMRAHGVCGQIIPWNFPLLMLAWKVAPALAAGNTVVIKPAEYTTLSALVFAEIAQAAGVPPGVLNIVTGEGETGAALVDQPVDKIAFTGSTEVGRHIRKATAGRGIPLTLELGGKSPYIVFDDADLDSAVEGLVDAIWFNQGQVCCAGSRLLVQEGIAEDFHTRLRARMDKLRIGDPLDKCIDVGAIVDPVQLDRIHSLVAANTEGQTHVAACALPNQGCFYPPTLITGLSPASPLMQEEIFGPVLVATTFRTPSEAVALANDTRYGLAASVWSENINLALDIAPKLAAGVVWVNGTNMFDAAAPFGGVRESGFGREGGWEGLAAYLRPAVDPASLAPIPAHKGNGATAGPLDRTAKLYIGGKQARPDGGYSKAVFGPSGVRLGEVGLANRKDIRNAVEAAQAAKAWSRTTGHLRAQILYYIAENLSARAGEFAARIESMTGQDGAEEVDLSIRRLFTYAAWADKFDGQAHGVPIRGVALAMREPTGVIGVFCADEAPLLGLVSAFAPAIAMGSRVVAVANEPFPLAATDFYQVLETSDVPAGVVNILTGSHIELAAPLAGHHDVDAVWSFSSSDISATVEDLSANNLKRSWVNNARARDWHGPEGEGRPFLDAATEVKTIWIPYGE